MKDLKVPLRDCDKLSYVLEVGTQGHHLLYQWYRNGLPIPGAYQKSYRVLSKDSSGFYRSAVAAISFVLFIIVGSYSIATLAIVFWVIQQAFGMRQCMGIA